MKRIVLVSVWALLAFSAGAQAQQAAPALPNIFPSLAACKNAMATGRLRFYEPRYFGLNTRNPTNGVDRVVVPLEADTCLEMLVVGGRQFVAQREGTLFRAYKLADGALALYARNDCGNPVYGIVYPAPAPAQPEPPPPPVVREPIAQAPPLVRRDPPLPPPAAFRPEPVHQKKGGFCSTKKCKVLVGIAVVSAGGYAAYQFWPCPPGTVRK